MTLRTLLLTASLTLCLPLHAATEVIQLNNRMAEDVIPVAESVLGNQGRVTAYGNQLIVNAPDSMISELRRVIDQLDVAPKRLLISVDTQDSASSSAGGYQVDGSVRSGDVEFETGRGETGGRDRVRIIRRSTNSRDGGIQQVQASEGYPALIQVGQSVPLTTQGTDGYGQIYQQTQYRDVLRGFYATATIHGDRVQISISSTRDRLAQGRSGVVEMQNADTRVSGRVGEWITIGGIDESADSEQRGTLRRYSTQGSQNLSMRLKVDVLD
ncbi:bacterial type II/III secretion system short domain protein [Pseudomonas sp. SCT]|uniref:secretin N-terminal domain-containing protein n=1 Tax=Pseudomonas sp. (strain SCT) TaxID=412955 RepID=UPI000EEA4FA3|nr:secretin N-terminal domain-containing protein [Pseudomonas sp. SCT]GCA57484.1 bacterial type II/III secretion system short domain protein [Pseudomonas sp. SCT]